MDVSGRYFGLDHNRCILCTRCVRTCDEVEGVHTLDIGQRGVKNQVIVDLNTSFGASTTCTQCGACVAACPTGALFDKQAAFHGPLSRCQTVRTTCTECSLGCGLIVYAKENRIVDVLGDPESPVNQGHLCVRGRYGTWAESRPRLLHPLVRQNGQLTPVPWNEALRVIESAVNGLAKSQKGLIATPRLTRQAADSLKTLSASVGRIGMYVSKNEAALCADPEFPTDALAKISDADAIIVLGATPSQTHGVLAARIRTTVRKHGAKLIILHAHKSDLDTYADIVAHVVSLERSFWARIKSLLQTAKRPVLVYGADAMSAIGVTILDRLIKVLDTCDGGQPPALLGLAQQINTTALAAAGVRAVDDFADWLTTPPLKFLHVVASDDTDGGAHLLQQHGVTESLQSLACLVVHASYQSRLTELATVVLPSTIWNEKQGTITNFEGRELPVQPVLPVRGEARPDKAILEMVFA
jgi:predicted molibdopterin-dependent oxidoreductase YjgC